MKPSVSVIILTYNAGGQLRDVLHGVFAQAVQPKEVIIIDSSSTDGTRELAREFPVKLHTIRQADFGHGKTRNYGARLATADYVVFLTQDAVPLDKQWLGALVGNLDNPQVAGAFSRQIARDSAVPMEKFFYARTYPARSKRITRAGERDILFSNASSAIRRDFLLAHPFDEDILMSEDMAWALHRLRSGYAIRYEAASRVAHSHDTSFLKLLKRYFTFGVSHSEIETIQKRPVRFSNGWAIAGSELRHLMRSGHTRWIPRSAAYNAAKFLGVTLGRHHRLLPGVLTRQLAGDYRLYWR